MKSKKMLGLVLLVGGAVLLGLGVYQFLEFQQSFGGKLASAGNQLSKALGGSSSIAQGYVQPIIMIVLGAVAGGVGFVMFKKR